MRADCWDALLRLRSIIASISQNIINIGVLCRHCTFSIQFSIWKYLPRRAYISVLWKTEELSCIFFSTIHFLSRMLYIFWHLSVPNKITPILFSPHPHFFFKFLVYYLTHIQSISQSLRRWERDTNPKHMQSINTKAPWHFQCYFLSSSFHSLISAVLANDAHWPRGWGRRAEYSIHICIMKIFTFQCEGKLTLKSQAGRQVGRQLMEWAGWKKQADK